MKKDVPIEVQKAKMARSRAKHASKRNAKRGITNKVKENLIHNLPYGLDNVPLQVGQQFARTFALDGRSYVQAVQIVNIMFKSDSTGEYFMDKDDIPENLAELEGDILEIPVTAQKTAVRI